MLIVLCLYSCAFEIDLFTSMFDLLLDLTRLMFFYVMMILLVFVSVCSPCDLLVTFLLLLFDVVCLFFHWPYFCLLPFSFRFPSLVAFHVHVSLFMTSSFWTYDFFNFVFSLER